MRALRFVALAALLGALVSCSKPLSFASPTRQFVPFRDDSGGRVEGDAVIAAPLRAPIVDLIDEPRDVVMLRTGSERVLIFHNDGAGVLTVVPARTIDVDADPIAVVAADFDDDGDADLAVACREPNVVKFLKNSGAGEFEFEADREIALPGAPVGLIAQQFDMEGGDYGADVPVGDRIDLAVAVNIVGEGGAVLIYHSDGSGHVLAHTINTDRGADVIDPIDDIDSGDVDNDKDIEIVIAAGVVPKSSVRVLLNRGVAEAWAFKEAQRLSASDTLGPLAVRRVRCVDLYRDVDGAGEPFRELLISAQRTSAFATRVNLVAANLGGIGPAWSKFDGPQVRAELTGAEVAAGVLFDAARVTWLDVLAFRPPTGGRFELFRNKSGATAGAPTLQLKSESTRTPAAGKIARITELDGAAGPEILVSTGYYTD